MEELPSPKFQNTSVTFDAVTPRKTMSSPTWILAPFGGLDWIHDLGTIFMFVVVAVMVPCCASDIVFPLLMTKEARTQAMAAHHSH